MRSRLRRPLSVLSILISAAVASAQGDSRRTPRPEPPPNKAVAEAISAHRAPLLGSPFRTGPSSESRADERAGAPTGVGLAGTAAPDPLSPLESGVRGAAPA